MPDNTISDDEQYYLDIIRNFASERLYFHAACVIEELSRLPSTEEMAAHESWPYAGPLSKASFADEAFWAYSFDNWPAGCAATIRSRCEKIVAALSDAEEEFLQR